MRKFKVNEKKNFESHYFKLNNPPFSQPFLTIHNLRHRAPKPFLTISLITVTESYLNLYIKKKNQIHRTKMIALVILNSCFFFLIPFYQRCIFCMAVLW